MKVASIILLTVLLSICIFGCVNYKNALHGEYYEYYKTKSGDQDFYFNNNTYTIIDLDLCPYSINDSFDYIGKHRYNDITYYVYSPTDDKDNKYLFFIPKYKFQIFEQKRPFAYVGIAEGKNN